MQSCRTGDPGLGLWEVSLEACGLLVTLDVEHFEEASAGCNGATPYHKPGKACGHDSHRFLAG